MKLNNTKKMLLAFVLPVTGILDEHTMVRISKAGWLI